MGCVLLKTLNFGEKYAKTKCIMKANLNIRKVFGLVSLVMVMAAGALVSSCSDKVDESNLYVFSGENATDFIKKQPQLSKYYVLLTKARSGNGRGSTMDHLLESRGNYTCFIPTDDAVQMFLDSVSNQNNFDVNQVSDSLAQVIVFNSIIDNGDVEAYKSTDFQEGVLQMKTMADRYIVINFAANDSGKVITRINTFSQIISGDNKVENGQIHVVDRVVMPASTSLPGLLGMQDNTRIFAHLLEVTTWADSMTKYRDDAYELEDHPQNYKHVWYSERLNEPLHHNYGYTAFVEPDSLLEAEWGITLNVENGVVTNWDEIMPVINQKVKEYYPLATSDDPTSLENALNQFVGYHIIDVGMAYNNIVITKGQLGYSYSRPEQLGIDKFEYYETMGKDHRIIKFTLGQQTDGIRINRYVSEYDNDTYSELQVPIKGLLVNSQNGGRDNQALNGFYHTIDGILVYNDDVKYKVLNERMRWDTQTMQHELLTNGLRQQPQNIYNMIPAGYCRKITFSNQTLFISINNYNINWLNYEADDVVLEGYYDITWQLPPVPYDGTYELRMGYCNDSGRGMLQFYFGTDPNNLAAVGLPIDARIEPNKSVIGWIKDDPDDADLNRENDKAMRNHTFMKCPESFGFNSTNVVEGGRNYGPGGAKLRHIITTANCKPGVTYYMRMKSLLNGPANFGPDFIEWVPKSVYNGSKPEDKW